MFDGPAFVRKLLCYIAHRIEDEHGKTNEEETKTPLSQTDVRQLTDHEIENFAQEISTHNVWLFESYQATDRLSTIDNKEGQGVVSKQLRKVTLPRNEHERDSDYLTRAVRRYTTKDTDWI